MRLMSFDLSEQNNSQVEDCWEGCGWRILLLGLPLSTHQMLLKAADSYSLGVRR